MIRRTGQVGTNGRAHASAWRLAVGALLAASAAVGGCGTVDPGDHFVAPETRLDEDFFFCRIQPEVLTAYSCATGLAGEGGTCHDARSALRLDAMADEEPPPCDMEGNAVSAVPPSYRRNLDAVRVTVQSDALSSPFYRRAVGLDTHPRTIFEEDSEPAALIREWINGGTM